MNTLSPKVRARLEQYYTRYYRDVLGVGNIKRRVQKRVDQVRGKEFFSFISPYFPKGATRVLDVGSGCGELLNQFGDRYDLCGVEPDEGASSIAREMMGERASIHVQGGESLPFEDNRFDVVTSFHVLEHVDDVGQVIEEMIRVLRPGGVLCIECPNYLYPKEGHYGLWWVYGLPKWFAKIYLRLRGRSSDYIGHINYITPAKLEKKFKNVTTYIDVAGDRYKKGCGKKSGVRRLLSSVLYRLGVYTPLQYIVTK